MGTHTPKSSHGTSEGAAGLCGCQPGLVSALTVMLVKQASSAWACVCSAAVRHRQLADIVHPEHAIPHPLHPSLHRHCLLDTQARSCTAACTSSHCAVSGQWMLAHACVYTCRHTHGAHARARRLHIPHRIMPFCTKPLDTVFVLALQHLWAERTGNNAGQ